MSIIKNNDTKALNDLLLPGEKDNMVRISHFFKNAQASWLSEDLMVLWRIDVDNDSYVTIYSKSKDFYYSFVVTEISKNNYGLILMVNDPIYQIVLCMRDYKNLIINDILKPEFLLSLPYKGAKSQINEVKLAFNYFNLDCQFTENGASKSLPEDLNSVNAALIQFFIGINSKSDANDLLKYFDDNFQNSFNMKIKNGESIGQIRQSMKDVIHKKIFKSAVISDSMYYLFYQKNPVNGFPASNDLAGLTLLKGSEGIVISGTFVYKHVERLFAEPEVQRELNKIFNLPSNTMCNYK